VDLVDREVVVMRLEVTSHFTGLPDLDSTKSPAGRKEEEDDARYRMKKTRRRKWWSISN
jgi:hypothetical protein